MFENVTYSEPFYRTSQTVIVDVHDLRFDGPVVKIKPSRGLLGHVIATVPVTPIFRDTLEEVDDVLTKCPKLGTYLAKKGATMFGETHDIVELSMEGYEYLSQKDELDIYIETRSRKPPQLGILIPREPPQLGMAVPTNAIRPDDNILHKYAVTIQPIYSVRRLLFGWDRKVKPILDLVCAQLMDIAPTIEELEDHCSNLESKLAALGENAIVGSEKYDSLAEQHGKPMPKKFLTRVFSFREATNMMFG